MKRESIVKEEKFYAKDVQYEVIHYNNEEVAIYIVNEGEFGGASIEGTKEEVEEVLQKMLSLL